VGVNHNMSDAASIFRLESVSKRYGSMVALDNINLAVDRNEYVSLLGPSGSGKTVLLRTIAGFETPDAGRIVVNGQDITELPAHKRGIGFVFQNFALFPHLTVSDNVAFGLRNRATPVSDDEVASRVSDVIKLVGLSGLEGRGIGQISGGQKQRVALARTLVTEPKLILLDEPLGALDANLRGRMRNELRAIRERLGVTFLHVTGSETEALAMGDRVVVLDHGRIAQFDVPDTVYGKPASPNVAMFLNRYNLFDGTVAGSVFKSEFGDLAFKTHTDADTSAYAIRYDRVAIDSEASGKNDPGFSANFLASEYLGSSIMYFFEAAGGKVIEVEHHLSNGPPKTYEPKKTYRLRWKPEDAIVFG
jgi:spermidine/putrescine transport system ATP-binding protein